MSSTEPWTSVSMPYLTGEHGDTWATEAARHGQRGTQKLLEVKEVTPPAEITQALNLAPNDVAVVRRRLILLDDHPIELADSYYPASIARSTQLAEPRKIRGGAVAHLHELGVPPHHVREDVDARLAEPAERAALKLSDPASVLILRRTLFTHDARPIEASIMITAGPARRLRYELTL